MNPISRYLVKHSSIHGREPSDREGICKTCYAILGIICFVLIWWTGGYLLFNRPTYRQFSGFLPMPTIQALGALFFDQAFWASVAASLRRVFFGIGTAFVIGMPCGLCIGYYKKLRYLSYAPIQFIRMVSPLSWMPIALLIFATFESAIYFLITMATVWPVMLNTSLGVVRVNRQWIDMGRIEGASDQQIITRIILPASVPYILTSLRLALGVAWIVLVPVEFLGISSGLGYLINDARDTMEYDRLMALVIAIGIIGFILDGMIQLVRNAFRWTYRQ